MLHIVSTPIGNLQDISLRQAETLFLADIILAEDTRSAQTLLQAIRPLAEKFHYTLNPNQKIISYYKEREFEKLPQVIEWLTEGKNIALISESGTPIISDPGYLLLKTVVRKNLAFTSVPGPSAIINSLILSGVNPKEFMFLGFLPKKEGDLIRLITKFRSVKENLKDMIFVTYESPMRINETLQILSATWPDVNVTVCREMTKKFEEVLRGKPKDLMDKQFKGEITLILF